MSLAHALLWIVFIGLAAGFLIAVLAESPAVILLAVVLVWFICSNRPLFF